MGLTYGIIALDESAIRTIVREAEIGMADGSDAKALLVAAAQDYIASENAVLIADLVNAAYDMADMTGTDVDTGAPDFLADVRADFATQGISEKFEELVAQAAGQPVSGYALAKAIITAKPVLPMHRGKWLSKIGIVASHIAALGSGSTASTPAAPAITLEEEQAMAVDLFGAAGDFVEYEDLADMLGLSEEPPAPLDEGGYADIADAQAPTTADAPIAVAPSHEAVAGPPVSADPRGALILFGQAASYDDAALAQRLGVSRSTVHNYFNGKTVKIKLTLAQARVVLSEIDMRIAKLAEAARLLAIIRE
jgi:AraC-like DNA-binding protein